MYSFLYDFADRRRQVRHYLAVVSRQERSAGMGTPRVQEARLLTLRAGTFLVLYNLIEASTRVAIEAIHDQITMNDTPFMLLAISLRKEIVRMFKKGADPEKDHTFDDFPSEFVATALAQGVDFSGNVDARLIRRIAEIYGFSVAARSLARDGADLLTIKTNRNDLSHGRKTFEEVGRDQSTRDLVLLSKRSMSYMSDILENIACYLRNRRYLEAP